MPPADPQTTRLVCGFGRCGSSLAMQMLAAGGADVLGQWPAYEPDEVAFGARSACQGRTAKILDPHRDLPMFEGRVLAIWLGRDPRQQAMSQAKFGHFMMGLPADRRIRKAYERSYAKDFPLCRFALLRQVRILPVLMFETMIREPHKAADALCEALDLPGLDRCKMAAVARPRSSDVYPGLLEAELIAA